MSLTGAAIEILLFSISMAIASALIRRALIKDDDIRRMMEANEYRRAMMKAMKERDKKTIERLERRKDYIRRVEAQTALKNLVVMSGSLAIFFSFFIWATGYYTGKEVLYMPEGFDIPLISDRGIIYFYGWYILSSLAVSLPLNKFLSRQMPSIWGVQRAETKPQDKK
ncbi:MAG: EMC3/TMCO1 family protein [Aigarchaeota archaeon]|nr:EMC3/TMCO1 family protein [Aigarchaeota archaeon]MDW8092928.1 EMC3/TMCO1 family protein [Nitrososphaerota archaeon]